MYADLLAHKATVRRRMGGADRFNQRTGTYQVHATSVACRVTRAKGAERNDVTTAGVVTETFTFYVLAGQDIKEDDRVTVYQSNGTSVLVDDAEIKHVKVVTDRYGSEHHRECDLEVIRGGR